MDGNEARASDRGDYKTKTVRKDFCAFGKAEDLEELIGKRVAYIENQEFELTVRFEDGSALKVAGSGYDGLPLGVDVNWTG
jgi:hypothetical protein